MGELSSKELKRRLPGLRLQYAEEIRSEGVRVAQSQAIAGRATVLISSAAVAVALLNRQRIAPTLAWAIGLLVASAVMGVVALLVLTSQETTASLKLWQTIEEKTEAAALFAVIGTLMQAREKQVRKNLIRGRLVGVGAVFLSAGLVLAALSIYVPSAR